MAPIVVLITGANRGLGLGLLQRFLAKPDHITIAANRDPTHPSSLSLESLPKGLGTKLIVMRYDAAVEQDPFELVKGLSEKHGIGHLDIVVANAAISKVFPLVRDTQRADVLEHAEVNVLGVLSLYQATRGLLSESMRPSKPIFAIMGSMAGTLGRQPPVPTGVYGPLKAMAHWYGIRINAEEEWLNAFVVDPGFAQTDMGNRAAHLWGLDDGPPLSADESCEGIVQMLTRATKEEFGGKMVLYTGEVQGW